MYNYLDEVAKVIINLSVFTETAHDASMEKIIPYSVYLESSCVSHAAVKAIIKELEISAKLKVELVKERNLGRCYNEYIYSVKAKYEIPDSFIDALRRSITISDGQGFSKGEQHKCDDGLFERIVTVTVDSSD